MRGLKLGSVILGFFFTLSPIAAPVTHEYHLNNGLKIIVREDHRAPVILSSIWYKVGGSYEPNGITGISHALEHMMFNGTKRFGPGELDKIVTVNGGQQNASTTEDYTMYYQKLTADRLALSMMLESDRMRNLLLLGDIFSRELKVVLEEYRMRVASNPRNMTYTYFNAAAFINSPYHQPVIGWLPDIIGLKIEDLRDWYGRWYGPNNAVLVIAGDVQPQKVFELAQNYFGNIQPITIVKPRPRTEIPPLGPREIKINLPAQLPWVLVGYNVPSLATPGVPRWKPYALYVLSALLAGTGSSRLQTTLVRHQQIATDVSVGYDPITLHNSNWTLDATPAAQHSVAELRQAIENEINRIKTQPISAEELDRVKSRIIADETFSKDSLESQIHDLGTPEVAGLSWKESEMRIANIKAITVEQIQSVAKEYLIQKNMTTAELVPSSSPKP